MSDQAVLVLDCGATNIRAVAVSANGAILKIASRSNQTQTHQQAQETWHIWSLEDMLNRLQSCCHEVMSQLPTTRIVCVTVTTFGVDGGLIDANDHLSYPIISWKCPRTLAVVKSVEQHFSQNWLQQQTGVGYFSFNTLYKLVWLKIHEPKHYRSAKAWLFISSLINQYLTGELTTDRTMAGTSQLFDIHHNQFHQSLLDYLECSAAFFPRLVQAGEIIGQLKPDIAQTLRLPQGIPVISAGHDTQFALFGSGAAIHQPVLSSGTWEILMVRSPELAHQHFAQLPQSTCELDATYPLLNPGTQWLASGVIEYLKTLLWGANVAYDTVLDQVAQVPIGSEGIRVDPHFLKDHQQQAQGGISGLSLTSSKAAIFRASLEALALTLRTHFINLSQLTDCHADTLILVGGGSKNALWNQIKADVLNRPIQIPTVSEITVLGAAMYAFSGIGFFENAEEARRHFKLSYHTITPDHEQAEVYQSLYLRTPTL